MKSLISQLKWQFVILLKNNLIYISIAVTLIYALIFYLIKDLDNSDQFLTLLIYNDPAIIGLFFVGLSVIMEKNDEVLPALFVTPVSHHVYVISRVISLSVLGWACAAGMTFAMLGPEIGWFHFSMGVFGTCLIFSMAGIFVVSYTTEFLNFMLRAMPVMLLLSLPLFNYFGVTDIFLFDFTPVNGALDLIIHSFEGSSLDSSTALMSYLSMAVWIPLLYLVTYKRFIQGIVKNS